MAGGRKKSNIGSEKSYTLQEMESGLIGDFVREARVEKGWSQADLARYASPGVDQTAISRIERGATADPSVLLIYRIAKALGVTVESLVQKSAIIAPFAEAEYGEGAYLADLEERRHGEVAVFATAIPGSQEAQEQIDALQLILSQHTQLEQRLAAIEAQLEQLKSPGTTQETKMEQNAPIFNEETIRAYATLIETHVYNEERKKLLHDAFDNLGDPSKPEYAVRFIQAEIETLRAITDFLLNKNDDHNNSIGHLGKRLDLVPGSFTKSRRVTPGAADVDVLVRLKQHDQAVAKILRAAFRVLDLDDLGVDEALQALESPIQAP